MTRQKASQILIGFALFVAFFALYTVTRTEVHTFDALSYTNDVETKPFIELYHPHHLLYGPVGRFAVDLAEAFGYAGRADQPIQAVNALVGALGVVALWRVGVRLTKQALFSAGVAALMGISYGYWVYAAEVEVYTVAALFLTLSILILTHLAEKPGRRLAILLGLNGAGAVLFHQTNAMFVLPVFAFLIMQPATRRQIIPYGVAIALAVGVPYIAVGWASGFRDADAYINWLTDYAQQGEESGAWGGYLSFDHFDALTEGLTDTISLTPLHAQIFYAVAILGGVVFLLRPGESKRAWAAFVITWLALYGAFFWWWEPWNIEFWIALLPLWCLLMILGWRALNIAQRPLQYAVSIVPFGLAMLIYHAGYDTICQEADAANDFYQQSTLALEPYLAETDIVVSRGNILDLYLPFYADHNPSRVISLRAMHLFEGGDIGQRLRDQIDDAYSRGQIVYIDAILLDEAINPQRNAFGLTQDEIDEIRSYFPIYWDVTLNDEIIFYSVGQRAAPDARAWQFSGHLNGWYALGMESPRFADGAWCIAGGGDPWLESPPVRIDTNEITQIEIEIEIDAPAAYGQLFWSRPSEGLDEARSLRFPLGVGRNTYRLDLAGREGWQDEITFLRFDPIPENLTVNACVYGITLIEEDN